MRAEVKALRDELATRLEAAAGPEAAGDDFSANKEISALITGVAAARARESMSAMRRSVDATAPIAMRLEDGTVLEEHEILELEMLQLENEELRCALRVPVLGATLNPWGGWAHRDTLRRPWSDGGPGRRLAL